MKLNNRGWGFKMMAFLMFILIFFLAIAIIYIYNFYGSIDAKKDRTEETKYVGER